MFKVKVNINSTGEILKKRNLEKNGAAQRFFTNEVARLSNPYVPWKNGGLKDTQVEIQPDKIIYKAPYAKKQYNENAGFGKEGINRGGLRGKQWISRMMNARGRELVGSVANFIGGRPKC